MTFSFDRNACLKRAKELLSRNDDDLLIYACLELRLCLESIAYDKLRVYQKRLPQEFFGKWQPPQALRALEQLEPFSNQDFELRICKESPRGVPNGNWKSLGRHCTFKIDWLRKTYNKLGNYIHVPTPSKISTKENPWDPQKIRIELQNLIKEVEPIAASHLDTSLAEVIVFECDLCGQSFAVNHERLIKGNRDVVCLNPNCNAAFEVVSDDEDNYSIQLKASIFTCNYCSAEIVVENRKLSIGYEFKCNKCGAKYVIKTRQWVIEKRVLSEDA